MTANIATAEHVADLRRRVTGLLELLEADELEVIELVAHGIARGREVYGELRVDRDRRDFRAEAGDELRDALVYVGAELLRIRRSR